MSFDPGAERWAEEESGGLPDFLFDPVSAAERRKSPMLIALACGLVLTLVVWSFWVPKFVASATILITSQKIPEHFVLPTIRADTIANINAMIGESLSLENLWAVIEANGLFAEQRAKEVDRTLLVNALRSRIEAEPKWDRTRGDEAIIYEISFESPNAREAAQVANSVATLLIETSHARRKWQAEQTTDFLREQLARTEEELRRQSKLVSEFRRKHRGRLPDELDANLRRLDSLAARRESMITQIRDKENRIIDLTTRRGDAPPTETEAVLAELRRELARQTSVNTEEHPNVIALRERIARLEEIPQHSPQENAARQAMIDSERREISQLRGEIARVDEEMARIDRNVDETPAIAEELAALEQKESVLSEDYTNTLRKVEAAELGEHVESSQQGGQISILDAAGIPQSPKVPRWVVGLAGTAISLGLALAVGVLLELIDPVLIGKRQVERLSDRPVLGTLPEVG